MLRAQELKRVFQVESHKWTVEYNNDLPNTLVMLHLRQARKHLAFWTVSAYWQLMLRFPSASTPSPIPSPSSLFSINSSPSLYLCLVFSNPYAGPCTLPCWTWGAHGHASPVRPLWMTSLHSSVNRKFVTFTDLLRVSSIPLSTVLTKMLKSTSPSTFLSGQWKFFHKSRLVMSVALLLSTSVVTPL